MNTKLACFVVLVLAYILQCAHARPNTPNVLVFGGNGFMGADTVELLLRYGYNVTIVNRGSWYWDGRERIFSRVQHVTCDRNDGFKSCKELLQLLETDGTYYDAVVDFSAYKMNQAKEGAELMKGKTGLYVLISTDSVYDVCIRKQDDTPYKETDAVRPEDEHERQTYEVYTYSNNKLHAEEEIVQQRQEGGIPYVIFRLPDVIGPRDATNRWWMYQLLLKLSAEFPQKPVAIPEFLIGYGMSMVYAPDVAKVIYQVMKVSEVRDQVFNLAWPEVMTLKDVLEDMKNELELESDVEIKTMAKDEERQFFLFPSGRRGPIDVTKAEETLGWKPTPWNEAVRDTVAFYETAMKEEKYRTQMDEIIQMVEKELLRAKDLNETMIYKAIEKAYGIDLKHFLGVHDEL